MQCCHLLAGERLAEQVNGRHLPTEHGVNVHLMAAANETLVKRLTNHTNQPALPQQPVQRLLSTLGCFKDQMQRFFIC